MHGLKEDLYKVQVGDFGACKFGHKVGGYVSHG